VSPLSDAASSYKGIVILTKRLDKAYNCGNFFPLAGAVPLERGGKRAFLAICGPSGFSENGG
jgi:hypothetical protein